MKEEACREEQPSATDKELKSSLPFTETLTDKLAMLIMNSLGSLMFLLLAVSIFTFWIVWNIGVIHGLKPFDPFPFPTLEMSVSILAIVLSISVLINQNRQNRIEKIRQQVEFEVNVRAEHETILILELFHEMHQKWGCNLRMTGNLKR